MFAIKGDEQIEISEEEDKREKRRSKGLFICLYSSHSLLNGSFHLGNCCLIIIVH